MASLVKSIVAPELAKHHRLAFSLWAYGAPKPYVRLYGAEAKANIASQGGDVSIIALVDDVLPRVMLNRTRTAQQEFSDMYLRQLPPLGFDEVHLVSEFMEHCNFWDLLKHGLSCSTSEFQKMLPKSKKGHFEDLSLQELPIFLWHVRVIEASLEAFDLSGFVTGIGSEFFYLACKHLLRPFDIYFFKKIR